jgi:protein O-mannosyl-transferase
MSSEQDRIKLIYILLVFVSGILLYSPSLSIPFLNDEIAFITRNQAEDFSDIISLWDKKEYDGDYYRPAGNFISGLLTSIISYNSAGYRIFNMVLHALNGVLVFLFISLLLNDKERHKLTPLFGALFFIAFPLNDYAVIWHTDLFDRIMMTFYLLSVIYFLKKNKPGIVSVLFFLLSLLSKEMALSLPAVILLLSYYRNRLLLKSLKHTLPYFVVVLVLILFRWIAFNNNLFNLQDAHAGIGIIPALKNVILFMGMLVFPFFLRETQEFISAYPLAILFPAILIFSGLLYWIIKFRRKDLMLFLLLLILIITILPASRLLMRWYMYLPSAGFAALLSYLIFSSKFDYRKLLRCRDHYIRIVLRVYFNKSNQVDRSINSRGIFHKFTDRQLF